MAPGRAGAAIGAPLAATKYRYSLLAATLAGALAPAYVIRWHVGPLPTTLLEVAILATIAVFAVETIQQGSPIAWRGPLTAPAVLFIVAGAISVMVAGDHRAALGLYRAYFLEPAAFALILAAIATTPRRAGLVLLGFAAGGGVVAVSNAVVVLDAVRHHVLDLMTTPPVAIYQTANAVALYLIPLIAMAGAILLHGRGRAERWLSVSRAGDSRLPVEFLSGWLPRPGRARHWPGALASLGKVPGAGRRPRPLGGQPGPADPAADRL